MPLYCYRRTDGRVVERMMRIGTAPDEITCEDGVAAHRSIADEGRSRPQRPDIHCWPRYSDSLGVHPDQVPEMQRKGTKFEFTPDGRAVFRSPMHERECLRELGVENTHAKLF